MKKYLLFDLDGTLTDPKIGITTCVQYALADQGIEEPDLDKLEGFIGPPLRDSFMSFYGFDEEQAEAAIAKYRERFRDVGLFENEIYKGMKKMLRTLYRRGYKLAVASSKPEIYVERILEHFHIKQYFSVVTGSTLDGTRDKKEDVIKEAFKRMFGQNPVPVEDVYMIGDRLFDVEGAHMQGIECVAVSYGYGSVEELMEAGADYIVHTVDELKEFLLREKEYIQMPLTLWQCASRMAYYFVWFVAVRLAVMVFSSYLLERMGMTGVSKDMEIGLTAIGYAAGLAVIYPAASAAVKKASKTMKLLHLWREPFRNYLWMILATLGLQIGLTSLLALTGLSGSAEYKVVAESQFGGNVLLGILCFGLITPVAEELMFRGVIYNTIREVMGRKISCLLTAVLFGLYHGNTTQALYAFAMGVFFVYAYEYFGSFKWPVILHMLVNTVAYLLSALGISVTLWFSVPVCAGALAVAVVMLILLGRQKNVMR
ncbi:MAG: HAD hydrolase-like protein [Lachnospiraceae bacterium]|nr:HAD hydrolase-like protein [Lachnospiraceae bacterium]